MEMLHRGVAGWRTGLYGDTCPCARRRATARAGINENYARELMELHTARGRRRILRNTTCYRRSRDALPAGASINQNLGGLFAFRADQHDVGEEGRARAPASAGRCVEDGEQVLDILARHPSTARFIAKKLVTHFVSDDPPPALVDRAAQTFMRTDGDIREVMRTIILSPEFNSRAAYRSKAKTPFELIASVLRAMNAAPDTTQRTVQLVADLGQRTFGHVTPEGWPDQGAAWLNMQRWLDREFPRCALVYTGAQHHDQGVAASRGAPHPGAPRPRSTASLRHCSATTPRPRRARGYGKSTVLPGRSPHRRAPVALVD